MNLLSTFIVLDLRSRALHHHEGTLSMKVIAIGIVFRVTVQVVRV